jgi:glutathione synthase
LPDSGLAIYPPHIASLIDVGILVIVCLLSTIAEVFLYFSEYMTDAIVSASIEEIELFLKLKKQIVLKPLNRCFGSGVMYLYDGDPNTRTIINTLTNNQTTYVMVQEYISEVKNGDIRVLTLGDKILPYSIKKLPSNDDFKFNTHNDEFLVVSELTQEQLSYFEPVAKKLYNLGIELAGLDVINQKIIEVNVTSPCYFIKEINNAYNINLEETISDYLLTYSLLTL